MARSNFQRSLDAVLKHEGGYVDHPKDPGGATNLGITIGTLRAWRRKHVSKDDVRRLTKEEAGAIYREQYWDAVRADDLPPGLDYALFDFAVNSGASRAVRALQSVMGLQQDGQIGVKTIAAIREANAVVLINALCDARLAFLQRLRTWPTFGRGWARRVAEVRRLAIAMTSNRPLSTAREAFPSPPAQGKARPEDIRATSTTEGKGAIATGVGTAGQVLTEAADKLQPLAEYGTALRILFAVVMVAGVAVTLWSLRHRFKAGELS